MKGRLQRFFMPVEILVVLALVAQMFPEFFELIEVDDAPLVPGVELFDQRFAFFVSLVE